ncbi:hypothetical protein Tco_0531777 [Tanacetum coccineum]
MSTYLNNIGGYKHNQLKSKSYEEIQKMFDNEMRRVNTFIPMDSKSKKAESSEEKAKGSRKKMIGRKRAWKEQQQESSKKQRMEDDKETDEVEEVEEDDEAELKKHLVIVKDDEIAIDAIPLATKPPMIVEYKLLKEGIMVHYQLIITDGSSKRYSSMIRMLQDIDREDLETLWKLVKTKHGDTRPEDKHERVLLGDIKVMFKPDIRSKVWRDVQGYTVTGLSSTSRSFLLWIDSILTGIEKKDYDSDGCSFSLEEYFNNDSISLPEYESFHVDYYNVLSSPPSIPEKTQMLIIYFDIEPDTGILTTKVVDDISERYVLKPKILTTQPTLSLCQIIDTLFPFSSENEDKGTFLSGNVSYFSIAILHDQLKYGESFSSRLVNKKKAASWIAPDYEDSRARGFVLHSLELQSISLKMGNKLVKNDGVELLDDKPDMEGLMGLDSAY